jgi:serine/threonine protein kinase
LKVCHAKKIIHRDIKPENVIYLPEKKIIKLIDFGLALDCSKIREASDFIRCGSFGYMAPEVMKNHGNIKCRYDYKCDIFSFGLVAHQLLFGSNPLIGKTF